MDTLAGRLRLRLLPALLTASGLALLAAGLMTYTTAVQPPAAIQALASYDPLPSLATGGVVLPGGTAAVEPSFPPDRVATRIVIRRLNIDLPIMFQTANYGTYPLCDVAMYLEPFGQPGEGRATYVYAHARAGMFGPLLHASQQNNGKAMIGMTVQVYTSDSWLFLYTIKEVRRHTLDLNDALATKTERLWMQTSEGPTGTVPKLQVVADFLSAEKTSPEAAHPDAHPVLCGPV